MLEEYQRKVLRILAGGIIQKENGDIAFPTALQQGQQGLSDFEKSLKIQELRESCGVFDKGRTIKFKRYSQIDAEE